MEQVIDRIEVDGTTYIFQDTVAKEQAKKTSKDMARYCEELRQEVSESSEKLEKNVKAISDKAVEDVAGIRGGIVEEVNNISTSMKTDTTSLANGLREDVSAVSEEMKQSTADAIEKLKQSIGTEPFIGATGQTQGEQGLVPAPKTSDRGKFLKGDGTWRTVIIPNVTETREGLMSASDKSKLDNIQENANHITKTSELKNDSGFLTEHQDLGDYATTEYVNEKISAVYKPCGSLTFAELPTLAKDILGNVYNMADAFTTTADFSEGEGHDYPAGTNIACVMDGSVIKWDTLSGVIDLSAYQLSADLSKVATSGSYKDLSNKPTIPTRTSQLTNDSGFKTADTTYTLTSSGSQVVLTGSDGKENSVTVASDDFLEAGSFTINSNGSYTEKVGEDKTITTTFASDGSMTQTMTDSTGTSKVKFTFSDSGVTKTIV